MAFRKIPPVKKIERFTKSQIRCYAYVWFPLWQRCSFSLKKSSEAWSVPLHRPSFLQRILPLFFMLLSFTSRTPPSIIVHLSLTLTLCFPSWELRRVAVVSLAAHYIRVRCIFPFLSENLHAGRLQTEPKAYSDFVGNYLAILRTLF